MNTFRKLTQADAAILASFGSRLFREAYQTVGDPRLIADYAREHFTEEALADQLEASDSIGYLCEAAEWRGYTMMTFHVSPFSSCEFGKEDAKVEKLYVDATFQGMGIGQTLLRHCETSALRASCQRIWLTVWPITPAPAFYQKMGYEQIGEVPFVYPDGQQEMDWVMAKVL